MLYLITCPLLDIPNVLYVFYTHYKTFKPIPVSRKITVEFDTQSTQSISEEGDMEQLHYNLAMNFHELQANESVFKYEYERVLK